MTWINVNNSLPEDGKLVDVFVEHRVIENYTDDDRYDGTDEHIIWHERLINVWYPYKKGMWMIDHPIGKYPMPLESEHIKVLYWMEQPPLP